MADIEIKLSTSTSGTSTDKVTCGLCRRQFAKYTCPTCNVPYCSLTCFRSTTHNQCSEGFYKKEIENDIHSGPSKTAEERQRMMELLQKFEEASSGQGGSLEGLEGANGEDEEEEDDDLLERLGSVDLDATSPEDLWELLTPDERKKFMRAFDDPTSELAQQLLSSDQLEAEIVRPWWEAPSIDAPSEKDQRILKRYGSKPIILPIQVSEIKPIPTGHPLGYNMCAICIAYAYITRHLGVSPLDSLSPGDPEFQDARRIISELVPFLTERNSTKLYPNLSAVVTDMWSSIDIKQATEDLFSTLLLDASCLMKPLAITEIDDDGSQAGDWVSATHPLASPVLVLSDLHQLLKNPAGPYLTNSKPKAKANFVTLKLRFYASHILSTPRQILWALAGEMAAEARRYKQQASTRGDVPRETVRRPQRTSKALVEEVEVPGQSKQ